jgi:hypothetical protein
METQYQTLDKPTPHPPEVLTKNNQLLPQLINESDSSETSGESSSSSDDDPMLGNLSCETQRDYERLDCEMNDREYSVIDERELYKWQGFFY